ncbi:unnamed protein product [Boreogadus saida]
MTTTEMTLEQQAGVSTRKQLVEEKGERDAEFLVKKAERSSHYAPSERDDSILEQAGDEVDVPEELLSMVEGEGGEEEQSASLLGHMSTLQNMDMDQMKEKASATVTGLRSKAEDKCHVM